MTLYPCPRCGKKDASYDGEMFCGGCEAEYQQQEYDFKQQRLAALKEEMDKCPCRTSEELCYRCIRRTAETLSLQGREADAEAFLNQ